MTEIYTPADASQAHIEELEKKRTNAVCREQILVDGICHSVNYCMKQGWTEVSLRLLCAYTAVELDISYDSRSRNIYYSEVTDRILEIVAQRFEDQGWNFEVGLGGWWTFKTKILKWK